MAFHSKRSPSKAKMILACSGCIALGDALPAIHKNQPGEAAQRGTAAHGLVENCLRKGDEPSAYMDRIILVLEEGTSILKAGAKMPKRGEVFFIVDEDMIDGATVATDYVRGRMAELGIGEKELQLETRTNPIPERPMEETSGTADITLDGFPDVLEVVDYKNGYIYVNHEANEQTMAYLLGKAIETGFSHDRYMVTIVQPNTRGEEQSKPRQHECTAKELRAFHKTYLAGIVRSEEADDAKGAPKEGFNQVNDEWAREWLAAGDHCYWCEAQAICPARERLAQADAGADFDEMEEGTATLDEPTTARAAVRILNVADRLERLIEASRTFALRELQGGFEVPGWKLVRGKTNRCFREDMTPEKIASAVVKGGFIPKNKQAALFTPPKLITAPAMEKLIPKDQRKEFNRKYVVKPEGRPTLAPASDPREEVSVNPADDFDDLED